VRNEEAGNKGYGGLRSSSIDRIYMKKIGKEIEKGEK